MKTEYYENDIKIMKQIAVNNGYKSSLIDTLLTKIITQRQRSLAYSTSS